MFSIIRTALSKWRTESRRNETNPQEPHDTSTHSAHAQTTSQIPYHTLFVKSHTCVEDDSNSIKNHHVIVQGVITRTNGMFRTRWSNADYFKYNILSNRRVSIIYNAMCKITNCPVVIKAYRNKELSELDAVHLRREIIIHAMMDHPNIIQFYGAYKQHDQTYLVLEEANGCTLHKLLLDQVDNGPFSDTFIVNKILIPLLNALAYIHSMGIIHRDVKLENIVFHDGLLKLIDFGIAINQRTERPVTRAGTLAYLSPEVLACPFKKLPFDNKQSTKSYDNKVDIWALGVVAFECMNLVSPYAATSADVTKKLIIEGSLPIFGSERSDAAKAFVYDCLTFDSVSRPSAIELMHHEYILKHMESDF